MVVDWFCMKIAGRGDKKFLVETETKLVILEIIVVDRINRVDGVNRVDRIDGVDRIDVVDRFDAVNRSDRIDKYRGITLSR